MKLSVSRNIELDREASSRISANSGSGSGIGSDSDSGSDSGKILVIIYKYIYARTDRYIYTLIMYEAITQRPLKLKAGCVAYYYL